MRTDHDPTATRQRLVREGISLAAFAALYGFGYVPSRHRPVRQRHIRTTVFVHGLWANRASFFPLQGFLRLFGHARQYSFNYRTSGSIEEMALALKRRLEREVKGGRIDLVCHSLGGLVARYYVQVLGGDRRVDRLVTLASPHHGTHSSAYVPTPLLSQLRPGGSFLRHLGAQPPPRVRSTSIVAGRDLLVLPVESQAAPFGESVRFEDLGHLDLLLSPRVFDEVHRRLSGSAG